MRLILAASSILTCRGTPPTPSPGAPRQDIRVAAVAEVAGKRSDTLFVEVRAVHIGTASTFVELQCNMTAVRLVAADPRITKTWDSETWRRRREQATLRRGEYHVGCIGQQRERLEPGDSVYGYGLAVPVSAILGDSLPSGRYAVTARARIGERLFANVPAGEVRLARRRPR